MAEAPQQSDGLICALELNGNGGAKELDWGSLSSDGEGLKWIHLNFTAPDAREWLRSESSVDGTVVEALLDEDSRPRAVKYDAGILLILRGVNTNPGSDPEDMVSVRLWIEKNRIISTRRRRLLSVVQLKESLDEGIGPRDAFEFVYMLINNLSSRIDHVVEALDAEIEHVEEAFAETESVPYGGEFSALRRQAARIRRYLAPQKDALERLSRESDDHFTSDQAFRIREEADQITRYLEDLDLVRERAILAHEELMVRLANEQNSRMYVLSLVAAIFLPLSFLTGLLGMNVAGLPGLEDPDAFLWSLGVMFAAAIFILVVFKWRKWL